MILIHLPIVSVLINQLINWLVYEVSKCSEKCNFEEPKATVQTNSPKLRESSCTITHGEEEQQTVISKKLDPDSV